MIFSKVHSEQAKGFEHCGFLLGADAHIPELKGTVEEIIRYHGRNGKTKNQRFGRIQWKKS